MKQCTYLPPASEGWGKVLFLVCLSVHTLIGGIPKPGLDGGGYPSQVWMVGVPRVPPRPGLDGRGYPGYPHHDWMGYPPLSLDGVPPTITGWGNPPPQTSIASTCVHAGGLSCFKGCIQKITKCIVVVFLHLSHILRDYACNRTSRGPSVSQRTGSESEPIYDQRLRRILRQDHPPCVRTHTAQGTLYVPR